MSECFDNIVVTSSNANQCQLFLQELASRRGSLGISEKCRITALSDPLGQRVGSGGATFYAISEAYEQGKNLLVLHSGGDSKRNPLCTVFGKGFVSMNFELVPEHLHGPREYGLTIDRQ